MIKIAISTNRNFYELSLPIVLESLTSSGIEKKDIYVFNAGFPNYEKKINHKNKLTNYYNNKKQLKNKIINHNKCKNLSNNKMNSNNNNKIKFYNNNNNQIKIKICVYYIKNHCKLFVLLI